MSRKINSLKLEKKVFNVREINGGFIFGINFAKPIDKNDDEPEFETVWLNCIYFGDKDIYDKKEYILSGYLGVKPSYEDYDANIQFVVTKIEKNKKSNDRRRKNKRKTKDEANYEDENEEDDIW